MTRVSYGSLPDPREWGPACLPSIPPPLSPSHSVLWPAPNFPCSVCSTLRAPCTPGSVCSIRSQFYHLFPQVALGTHLPPPAPAPGLGRCPTSSPLPTRCFNHYLRFALSLFLCLYSLLEDSAEARDSISFASVSLRISLGQ